MSRITTYGLGCFFFSKKKPKIRMKHIQYSFGEVEDRREFDGGAAPIFELGQRPRIPLLPTDHVEVVDDEVEVADPPIHRLLHRLKDVRVSGRDLRE